ncbi:lysophospholipid acyltransferase family protein [Desulfovibrio mangrovi]|uniref:lysophospholipid acyltransferase family protein n=1 Tax=Desulfovibrio mangrovi TaxID=2976983 RepID=UPI0022478A14|nr:GNAT family N-acyltransferase [Desulfovibrio mangrovi]UZP66325.1 lysophospholipid acyltransferase family protein [Desulfovibrio mangrovi]
MLDQVLQQNELSLDFIPPAAKRLLAPATKPLLRLSKLHRLFTLYGNMTQRACPLGFALEALDILNVSIRIKGEGFDSIPGTGPLVVVSNHPFGALEGLVLMASLLPVRPDMQFLANSLLGIIPELKSVIIDVNPFSTREARTRNIKGLRSAIGHVEAGNSLAVFPAGEVSHLQPAHRGIMDPLWNRNVARIIRKTGADVLPLYFHGRNSLMFNIMGLMHPLARTAMLPRELLKKQGSSVKVSVGKIIPSSLLNGQNGLASEEDVTNYLRVRSYSLRQQEKRRFFPLTFGRTAPPPMPLALPRPKASLLVELDELPKEQILLRENGYTVFETRAFQMPNMLHELGRLREATFRPIGEGSGRDLDLDPFDYEYNHIILWNEADQQIAGAYRLGQVRKLITTAGSKGLYCSTLFKFKKHFFAQYGDSVELGRAIVHPDYQRDYNPLMLLWKGIGQFVLRRPGLRYLFGPCSLPLNFNQYTLATTVRYLETHHANMKLETMVTGRKPPRLKPPKGVPHDIDIKNISFSSLNGLVKDMENGRPLPILFKHYLKLGGRIGAFHEDNSFGTLDAFLLIDLAQAPRNMLCRYMGKEAANAFLLHHTAEEKPAP